MNRFIRKTKKKMKLKKNNLKIIGLLSIFVVAIGLFASKVFAANSTYELSASPTTYSKGDYVSVSLDLNSTDDWGTASFTVQYDTDVFDVGETYYEKDLTYYDGSSIPNSIKKDLKVVDSGADGRYTVAVNAAAGDFSGSIHFGTLELKIRDDAPGGVTTLSFFNETLPNGNPGTVLKDGDKNAIEFDVQSLDLTIAVPVETHGLDKSEVNLDINKKTTDKINVVFTPSDTTDLPNATFESRNPSIATVDANGNVTAVAKGNTIIDVEEFGVSHEIPVTVTAELIGIQLDEESLELAKTQAHTYVVTTNPASPTGTITYNWSSSDTNVATVTNGVVTAVSGGTATITATAVIDGDVSDITATSLVNVVVPFSNVYASPNSITLTKGTHDSEAINVVYEPGDATQTKSVSWSVNPTGIVSINNGTVTALAKGDAVVTGTVAGVTPFTVNVHVDVPISTFGIDESSADLYIGQEQTLTPSFTPELSTISETTTINWSVSPSGVVSVDNTGKITALAAGTATVTATTGAGERLSDTVAVTVYTPISGITLSESNFTLYTNQTGSTSKTLTATINPDGAGKESDKAINWSVSPAGVVTVENGVVTAVANGDAVVTATLVSDPTKTATANVTVKTKVESFTITSSKDVTIEKGGTHTIVSTITPTTASDKTISWESGDESKVTVDGGVVTAVGNGTTTVTGTVDGKSDSITVHVITSATGVTITEGSTYEIEKNHTAQLHAVVTPGDSTDNVVWSSDDETVLSVDSSGEINAHKAGTATIKARAGNKEATIEVTVVVKATSFTISEDSITLNMGNYKTLTPVVSPSDTTDTITWGSDAEGVATVDENGKVTAVGTGNAVITGTINGISRTVNVTVTLAATKITINGTDPLVLEKDATADLTAAIEPTGSTDTVINWSSNPEGVVTIDSTGHLVAVGTGTTTITANVGTVSDTMTVNVILSATSVTITEGDSVNVNKNETTTLHATVAPTGSTDTLTWSSDDETVATVSSTGVVTAHKVGNATITARAGSKTDTITVNVKSPTTSVVINDGDSLDMIKGQEKTLSITIIPSDSTDTKTFSGYDSSIVTVDANGKVTAVGTGDTSIIVTSGSKSDTIAVHVTLPATSVTIGGPESITVHREATHQLSATVEPTGTTDSLVWVSTNPGIASVDSTGKVTGVAIGSTTITARAGTKTDTVTVTVDAPITAFTTSEQNVSIVKGKTKSLNYTITPSDTTDSKTITWNSNDTSKVTVDSTGKITAKGQGSTTVTATLGSRSITYNITVTIIPVEGLTLNKDSLDMLKGETNSTLTYTITPEDTTEATTVTWESDDETVATVDSTGKVTAKKAGTAHITARMGTFNDSVTVTVTEVHLTGISLEKDSDTVEIGSNYQIVVKKEPANSTDDVVFTFESSDPDIATVDENGFVKGKKSGSVTITVKSSVGDYETSMELNVVIPSVAPNPKTGVKSVYGYLIAAIMSLFGTIIVAKKRFN